MFVLATGEFISVMKNTVVFMTKMKAIISDDNIENHSSSEECDSEESSEEDESSDDDGSLENKTLGNHMALLSDINKYTFLKLHWIMGGAS